MPNPLKMAGQYTYRSTPVYLVALGLSAAAGGWVGYKVGTSGYLELSMGWCMASGHFCPQPDDAGNIDLMTNDWYIGMMCFGMLAVGAAAINLTHRCLKSSLPKDEQKIPTKLGKVSNRVFAAINDNMAARVPTMIISGAVMAALGAALFTSLQQADVTARCAGAYVGCPEYDDQGDIIDWFNTDFKAMLGAGIGLGFVYGLVKAYKGLAAASEAHQQEQARAGEFAEALLCDDGGVAGRSNPHTV